MKRIKGKGFVAYGLSKNLLTLVTEGGSGSELPEPRSMFQDLRDLVENVSTNQSARDILGTHGTVQAMIAVALNFIAGFGFAISLATLAYAFIQYTMSKGEKELVATAQQAATWSAIAMLITILAVAFKAIVFKAIGVVDLYSDDVADF